MREKMFNDLDLTSVKMTNIFRGDNLFPSIRPFEFVIEITENKFLLNLVLMLFFIHLIVLY